jgi:peptidoglycan hydrolase-like protein with peptidoglycan-binding domain
MTAAEIQVKIAEILALVASLQEQLAGMEVGAEIECGIASFDRNLQQGMSGNDVRCLQIILNSSPDTRITAAGDGSAGKETTYFGSLTKAAVIKFQEKYASEILTSSGLNKGTGFVASATRAKLNGLLSK